MESPLPKCSFFNFSFALFISKLFINEDILNFYHGWLCQRSFKFHIRNRRKLFAAASTRRRRKSASTRFFANKRLQVKNRNLFFEFFLIILQERHSCTSCKNTTLYLYCNCTFFAAKSKGAILCACVILCASVTISRSKIGDSC